MLRCATLQHLVGRAFDDTALSRTNYMTPGLAGQVDSPPRAGQAATLRGHTNGTENRESGRVSLASAGLHHTSPALPTRRMLRMCPETRACGGTFVFANPTTAPGRQGPSCKQTSAHWIRAQPPAAHPITSRIDGVSLTHGLTSDTLPSRASPPLPRERFCRDAVTGPRIGPTPLASAMAAAQ